MKMTPWEHSMTMYASFRHHLFTVIRMQERNSVPRLWDPNGIKLWQTINEINLTITPVTFGWLCRSSIFFPIEKLTFSSTWTSRGTTCDRTKLIYQSSWLSPTGTSLEVTTHSAKDIFIYSYDCCRSTPLQMMKLFNPTSLQSTLDQVSRDRLHSKGFQERPFC